jgi:NAD(P)-dependent dehydrogenase (short-subunit alcohol dehydrogenase family)
MGKLDSKVALVTGASRGFAREIATAFAAEGAKVAVSYNASASRATTSVEQILASGGILHILAGIPTAIALYSINLRIPASNAVSHGPCLVPWILA